MRDLFPSRYVMANGLRFHYVESGPESGPPVLLLHGFPECWYSFRYQLSALGQSGFRAIAPDLRGYNRSDKPSGISSYVVERLLDDIVGLTQAFGYEKLSLCGHDWGGTLAWATAASPAHRHVVERLMVLNAPHPLAFFRRMTLRQLRRSWYMLLFQLPELPERMLSRDDFAGLRRALRGSAYVPGTFSDEDLAVFTAAMAQPGALTAALNYYRALRLQNPLTLAQRVAPITVPSLLIWGERDVALGKELTYDLTGHCPNLRIEYLPDAGHWVQQEQPEQVSRLLLDFLPPPRRP